MFPVNNDYEQVTVAGFHMLHRSVWQGIIDSLELYRMTGRKDDLKGKIEMFEELGLERTTYYCFACAIAGTELHLFNTNCSRCPIVSWQGMKNFQHFHSEKALVPNCCHKDYFPWSEFITPDNYANKGVLAQNLEEHPVRAVLECAKSIRDLPWHDSNDTLNDLYQKHRNGKE